MRRFAVLASVLVVAGDPAPAAACSPPPCSPGFIVPSSNSTVPANIPVLYVRSIGSHTSDLEPDPSKLTLVASNGPAPTFTALADAQAKPTSFVLTLDTPLVAGTTYTLADANECKYPDFIDPPTATFSAAAAAPLPTTLGTLDVSVQALALLDLATISGSCDSPVEAAQRRVTLQLSADAAPWKDVLHVETLVDGRRWGYYTTLGSVFPPGASALGRGVDLVYAICSSDDPGVSAGVAPGAHEVVMRATLPGTSLSLETAPVTVHLDCPPDPTLPDPPPDAETGCATSRPSLVMLVALLLLRRRRR